MCGRSGVEIVQCWGFGLASVFGHGERVWPGGMPPPRPPHYSWGALAPQEYGEGTGCHTGLCGCSGVGIVQNLFDFEPSVAEDDPRGPEIDQARD